MKRQSLKEDKPLPKLPVLFSAKIMDTINKVKIKNSNCPEKLLQWYDYIDSIKSHISNPVIAWDNTNRFRQFPNGAKFVSDFDFNIGYVIKTNKQTQQNYVYVMVNLKIQDYDLNENKNLIRISETEFKQIITESVKNVFSKLLF